MIAEKSNFYRYRDDIIIMTSFGHDDRSESQKVWHHRDFKCFSVKIEIVKQKRSLILIIMNNNYLVFPDSAAQTLIFTEMLVPVEVSQRASADSLLISSWTPETSFHSQIKSACHKHKRLSSFPSFVQWKVGRKMISAILFRFHSSTFNISYKINKYIINMLLWRLWAANKRLQEQICTLMWNKTVCEAHVRTESVPALKKQTWASRCGGVWAGRRAAVHQSQGWWFDHFLNMSCRVPTISCNSCKLKPVVISELTWKQRPHSSDERTSFKHAFKGKLLTEDGSAGP